MNAERLLQHYERIADAPDAIARLRRFILDLAVRGKLVLQDATDEPASELLRRIGKEKLDQAALPKGWRRAKVGSVLDFQYGKGLKAADRLDEGPVPVFGSNGIVGFTDEPLTARPSIIVGRKGSAGALNLCDGPSWTTDVAYFVEAPSFLDIRFMLSALAALGLDKLGKGVKPGLSRSEAYDQIIAIPPLEEQHRIVAKVDELMGLCDRLEAAREAREATRDRLVAASLARLSTLDPDTVKDDARFALDALLALTTRPDQIKRLRQTILNLAVRGKLLPQDGSDKPAPELLEQIAAERAELIKRKEIRREERLSPIQLDEMPFSVPSSWVWTRIGDAVLFTQYGTSQRATPSERGVPVLTMGNIQDGSVVWGNEKRIPDSSEELPALYVRKFDILYNRTNSAELVGKTGIYLGDGGVRTFASYLIRLRPSLVASEPRFLNLAMNTSEFREAQIVPLIKKQTGQANVNGTALKNMLIPLPPLAEQRRIVAKVDALMNLCNRLEERLRAVGNVQQRLLEALLLEALSSKALDQAAAP